MLIEIYIEALLVDEELADQVWEALDTEVSHEIHCRLASNSSMVAGVFSKPGCITNLVIFRISILQQQLLLLNKSPPLFQKTFLFLRRSFGIPKKQDFHRD